MNGERPTINGAHSTESTEQSGRENPPSVGPLKQASLPQNPLPPPLASTLGRACESPNGDVGTSQPSNGDTGHDGSVSRRQAPAEILQLISQDSYLPLAALISRASQSCWNGLGDLVEQLSKIAVADPPAEKMKFFPDGRSNNQTKENLDKKERLFVFANNQKADFIKLLVLLQWSKNVDEVSKTISLNYWLMLRRQAYWNTIGSIAVLKRESPGFQIPNPDLATAAEVLSRGTVSQFPRLGYVVQKDLSSKQILRILKSLDHVLSVKLALSESLPSQLQTFRIHDGRATFNVRNEFDFDVSTVDDETESPLRMVDFRFSFQPSPHIPDRLHSEIENLANSNIDQGGLQRCYEFLHELALSYKLAEYHKQAIELSRNQWAGNLRVELIRRSLVVQYWSERQIGKSWIEISIASGRRKSTPNDTDSNAFLEFKCTQQGKRTEVLQLQVNESILCFEDILRQVVAQHTTQILDNIYDRLVLTPLFASAELSLQQSISCGDPEECSLVVQTSHSSQIQLKVESITGLVMLSPVTERTERLQFEVNRVQAVSDEVVSKLLNFRCSVMESAVLAGISGTGWEVLQSFKFSLAEVKSLFGRPVVRMHMFRQNQWATCYSLAITHSQDGDYWWLLQQIHVDVPNSPERFKVLRGQRIEVTEDLTSVYFARLAEYSTGVICLQRNADYFQDEKVKFDLRPFPKFERHYELPELTFDLDLAKPAPSRRSPPTGPSDAPPTAQMATSPLVTDATAQRHVRMRGGGLNQNGDKVSTIAQYQVQASLAVVKYLDESVLDTDVTLNPKDRMVTIRVETSIGDAAVPEIVGKVADLEKVVSTVEQVHGLPGFDLKSVSSSRISIVYHQAPTTDLGLDIFFASGSAVPRLDFLPPGANPHQVLTRAYRKMFEASRKPFAMTMRDLLTNLTLTLPLLTYVQKVQQPNPVEQDQHVRVHVLARTETSFALQYFTPARQTSKEVKTDSPFDMLARFEIYNHVYELKRPMWALRPAMEEFQSYSRPSFSSSDLLAKVKQEIFSLRPDVKVLWSTLDGGAACLTDRPEPLLLALHKVLSNWAKQASASVGKVAIKADTNKVKGPQGPPAAINTNLPNGAINRAPGVKGPPGRVQPSNAATTNGANMKMHRPPPNAARPMSGNAKSNAKNSQKEVITLD